MSLLTTIPERETPPTLAPLRERARQALQRSGLPTKKTEAWRFTPVRHLLDRDYPKAEVVDTSAGWAAPGRDPRAHFRGAQLLALPQPQPGLKAYRAVEAPAALLERLGTVATNEHFVALNSVSFTDALLLVVGRDYDGALDLDYEAFGTSPAYPRVLIVLEAGARLRLVERAFGQSALSVPVTEVVLGPEASLDHVRVHSNEGALLGTLAVAQERASRYRSLVASFEGAPLRLDLDVRLLGPCAEAYLDGIYLVGDQAHVDHHVRAEHVAPHCRSQQRYRGVLDGKATAVFDGQALVRRSAPGSEAHQHSRSLLLSGRANVYAKPHLEIDHDDVVASHGATVGTLDEDPLFYLRSRGIPAPVARGMLAFAFLEELVNATPVEAIRSELTESVLARLPEAQTLRAHFEELP